MPRKPRQLVPGGVHHVGHHVNLGRRLFAHPRDRRRLLRLVREAAEDHGLHVLMWCLMDSHYHLLVEDTRARLPRAMHQINSAYARSCKARDRCAGTVLWQRYFGVPVETDRHLLAVARYVPLNPVVAGRVGRPEEWPWSSHVSLVAGRPDAVADHGRLLAWFEDSPERYRWWVDAPRDVFPPSRLPRPVLEEVRPPLRVIAADRTPREAAAVARRWWYPLREIAAALDVSVATAQRWTCEKKNPALFPAG
jgi:REP element-mobilizing transposase RayT